MRFMGLLRGSQNSALPSSRELLEKMGQFMDEVAIAGPPLTADGIQPSWHAARVRLADGRMTVSGGSADDATNDSAEPAVSYAMFEVKSISEAIEWTASFLRALGEGECEIRPVIAASDA
jgi:hypothetical protein